jgi:prepilin-type N-terminal cleavage/methylation domain-containing protein
MEMKYARKQQGFTLVELIVAMSLFSIIVVVISGIFMQTVKFQKIVANRAAAIDNLGLAMEEIARGTRTGVKFTELDRVGRDSSVGVTELEFENYKTPPEIVRYYFNRDDGRIYKEIVGKVDPLPITSSNIEITDLKFILRGKNSSSSTQGDKIPPRITISMTAKGIYSEPFTLQTTVGARLIYYKAR